MEEIMARRPNKKEDPQGSKNAQDLNEADEYNKGMRAGKEDASKQQKRGSKEPRNAVGGQYVITTHANGANDIEMHSLSDQLLEPLGKLSQHLINGRPIVQQIPKAVGETTAKQQPVGGIMRMSYIMAVGDAADPNDGLNLGSNSLFNFVRSKTGGTSYYEAPDLGIYNICATSLYVVYAVAARLYGTIANQQTKNLYTAEAMTQAMGFNYDDFAANILDFRGWLNLFAEKVGTTCIVPEGLQYFRRQTWLASNIYMDSEMEQSQYYLFIPQAIYKWNEGVSATQKQFELKRQRSTSNPSLSAGLVSTPWTTGSALIPITNQNALCTFAELREFAEDLYDSMRGSQDAGYIAAGYLRAFENSIMMLAPIDETYRVDPVYNEEVLMQIENSMVTGTISNIASSVSENVSINKGYLEVNYYALTTVATYFQSLNIIAQYSKLIDPAAYRADSTILNFHNDENVTPAKVMEASRMLGPKFTRTKQFTDGSLPDGAINSNAESAGLSQQWYELSDVASEIFIERDIVYFAYKDPTTPWAGLDLQMIPYPTYIPLFTLNQRFRGEINAILAASGDAQTALVNRFVQSLQENEAGMQELQDLLLLAEQWDWHPRLVFVYASLSSGNDVVIDDYTFSNEGLDFNVTATLSDSQLRELNRYDIYSQFTCRKIGDYLPKF